MDVYNQTRITIEMPDGKTIRLESLDVTVSMDRYRTGPFGMATEGSNPYARYLPDSCEFTVTGRLLSGMVHYGEEAPPLLVRLARAVLDGDREAALLLADAVQQEWLADPRQQELPRLGG